eukprot:1188179-Prorocentrum_minimum.AAC.1
MAPPARCTAPSTRMRAERVRRNLGGNNVSANFSAASSLDQGFELCPSRALLVVEGTGEGGGVDVGRNEGAVREGKSLAGLMKLNPRVAPPPPQSIDQVLVLAKAQAQAQAQAAMETQEVIERLMQMV